MLPLYGPLMGAQASVAAPRRRGLFDRLADRLVPGDGLSDEDKSKLFSNGLLQAGLLTLATPTGTGSALMGVSRGLLGGLQGVQEGADMMRRDRREDMMWQRQESEYQREQQLRDLAGQFRKPDGSFDMEGYRNAYMAMRPEEFVAQRANLSPRMQAIEAAKAAGQLTDEQYQMAVQVELGLRPGASAPTVAYVDGIDPATGAPTKVPVMTRGIDWTGSAPGLLGGGAPAPATPPSSMVMEDGSADTDIAGLPVDEQNKAFKLAAQGREFHVRGGRVVEGRYQAAPASQAVPPLLARPGGSIVAGLGTQERINEAAATEAAKVRARQEAELAGKADAKASSSGDTLNLLTEAERLLPNATGGGLGALFDGGAAFFGRSTEGARANAALATIAGQLTAKMPRMEGPQSNTDVKLYQQMAGDLANANLPVETRLAALRTIRELNEKYAQPAGSEARAPSAGQGYQPGQVIEINGKRYRVVGGDPTDPEVEEI